ncbi:MAG: pyridoxal-5'-phosphate-dependent protein subunit beta [Gemmatimonadota bacterium]|jgi:cysteine synthase|nr:pyridoxal-5'-phosphate-dependent protein subunit beta [Gemmatimonadota bacterium]MDP7031399.1 pyridoxal-5'-phosphate-dependent protein subunit beta [Gemmatimonadota bacterium]
MAKLGLEREIVDRNVYDRTVDRFAEASIVLPRFSELADPSTIPVSVVEALAEVDPDAPHPLNLFRVHWHNSSDRRGFTEIPDHLVLPTELTGVAAPIVVALGNRFPMIRAHKVLAAYACLVPRLITGQFDPTRHRAVWPSTGNYCRGGIAISRILDCHGVAVLPEGMSRERFEWLEKWATDPADIVRTPGSESNVKEIYDECARLDEDPDTIIFNQFSEFGNHLAHFLCTGRALETIHRSLVEKTPGWTAAAFVSATGSAGTIAAGDYLKERFGSKTVAVEALECPTLLSNGFGEHNIQGIGDKHIPLIHHVMNTDFVVAVSDRATDSLNHLFSSTAGRDYLLARRGLSPEMAGMLPNLGISGICNVLAAIKTAKYLRLGATDAIYTVATDGAEMYATERTRTAERDFPGGIDSVSAAEAFGRYALGAGVDHLRELTRPERDRVFNLGYFTWVEQQGVSLHDFERRRTPEFWLGLREWIPAWDDMIDAFNARARGKP